MSREASGDTPELDRDEESADLDQDERQEVQSPRNARSWWRRRRVDPDDRDEILGKLFFEGERHKPYLYRFSLLQALSAVIAVLGVLSGSPAIVIGAMLLSPLMTPVLALAAGLVMAWPRRAAKACLVVLAATLGSVLLAWLVALVMPHSVVVLPYELLSRTRPTLLDLVVALAAGAAGGYALVREEVGTALPGVAVAVALVPPLAVIGASLELGRTDLALGAGLLYVTNLAAILLAGGMVFLATGFIPAVRIARLGGRVVLIAALSLVTVGVLAIPLTLTLRADMSNDRAKAATLDEVKSWLGTRDIEVVDIEIDRETVTVDLIGEDTPATAAELGSRLEDRLGRTVQVTVSWVDRRHDTYLPEGDNDETG